MAESLEIPAFAEMTAYEHKSEQSLRYFVNATDNLSLISAGQKQNCDPQRLTHQICSTVNPLETRGW